MIARSWEVMYLHKDPSCVVLFQNKTLLFMAYVSKKLLILTEHFCANFILSPRVLTINYSQY
jgi:hypothetical protein